MKSSEIIELAELLHTAGLDSFSYPQNHCAFDWHEYRLKIAEELYNRNVRIEEAP